MKVGILTFHRARNYGAVLQCYALSTYLSSIGFDVEVVDYYPKVFKEEYSKFPYTSFYNSSFKGKIHIITNYVFSYPIIWRKRRLFESFLQRELNLSSIQYDDENNEITDYDVLFFGSDQIWNPRLTNGFDKVFTGDFNSGNSLLIAYAASTTFESNIDSCKHYDEAFKKILQRFDCVSTREKLFAEYLNSFNIKKVEHVLDPVFLLNKTQWEKMAVLPHEKGYLLVYSVPQNVNISNMAKRIAKKKNLQLIEIVSREQLSIDKTLKQVVSPQEFVGYFINASFVVTSSFHGTAFSVKLHKQFITVMKGNAYDSRANNLLDKIDLTNRAVRLEDSKLPSEEIDYNIVEYKLGQIESLSKEFLNNSLKKAMCHK